MRPVRAAGLTLEPQREVHADEMFAVLSDPAIYEFESEPPQSIEGLRERFRELESRRSPNGRELWFNWVIRLPDARLVGYVQATLYPGRRATIAYEMGSAWWGRGLGSRAVAAMLGELVAQHDVRHVSAFLKRVNHRSLRLLERNGFTLASPEGMREREVERDEWLMLREFGEG